MKLGIIFDTETNGKIVNWKLPLTGLTLKNDRDAVLANYPRIAQIAWEIVDLDTAEVLRSSEYMIKPDGWKIPTVEELQENIKRRRQNGEKNVRDEEAFFFVNNNMSTERCEREGVPMADVLQILVEEINMASIMVAHNSAFDMPVLKCEMIRYGFKAANSPVEVCTMKSSVNYCKIPHANGRGYKWPQLGELYQLLFGEDMGNAHDAFDDTAAARKCFFKLIELRQIILQ